MNTSEGGKLIPPFQLIDELDDLHDQGQAQNNASQGDNKLKRGSWPMNHKDHFPRLVGFNRHNGGLPYDKDAQAQGDQGCE